MNSRLMQKHDTL